MNDTKIRAIHIHSKGKKKKNKKKKNKKKKSMYPPQNSQKAHVLANNTKFTDHFSIWTVRNGNPKFYNKLRKIRSIRQPTQQITRN